MVLYVADWVAPFSRSQHSPPPTQKNFLTPPSPPPLFFTPLRLSSSPRRKDEKINTKSLTDDCTSKYNIEWPCLSLGTTRMIVSHMSMPKLFHFDRRMFYTIIFFSFWFYPINFSFWLILSIHVTSLHQFERQGYRNNECASLK